MVGLTDESIQFIQEFTDRRFFPEKITPSPPPPAAPSSSVLNSFPDLPTLSNETLWPANINVHNKKEEEYLASLKKTRKKKAIQPDLRSAALLTDPKPKKTKKKEMSLETALKELGIQKGQKTCSCQATRHGLLMVAPNCLNCGRIRCIAEGVGPCADCKMPMISEEQEALLIAEAKQKRAAQPGYVVDKEKILEKKRIEKTKVMTIDSRSKQVKVKNIESSSSSSEEEMAQEEIVVLAKPAHVRGVYAYNPLLKGEKGPKFIRKKQKKTKVKTDQVNEK
ncbi:unnamed protein product [Rhizopus stolonifer]